MGMHTKATVDIAAPRDEVFRWLVEPDKLTAWLGGEGAMPADPSVLKVGYTATGTMPAPEGPRSNTLTVTAWDPPSTFGCTITYAGGDSISLYTLTETATGTHLELTGDTDWAQADTSAAEHQLEGQDAASAALGRAALENMKKLLADGAWDDLTRNAMQKSLEESLAKLKQLVEGA